MFKISFIALLLVLASFLSLSAQTAKMPDTAETDTPAKAESSLPKPDVADGKYGDNAANTFDLWRPVSKKSTPLVVFIHGGGLSSGDKSKLSASLLAQMLKNGLAVMSINYRLTPEAVFPQHYMDCARAIQFARYHAKELNIDPSRIAASGTSAGGMTALWIGFHDDMAGPKSADPVLRESTRVRVIAVTSAQTTLEPDLVDKYVGPKAREFKSYNDGKMFGLTAKEMSGDRGKQLYKEISPLTYLTKDDPPVWAFYSVPNKPLTAESTASEAIHHPGFGVVLKEQMDKVGVQCKLRHKDDGQKVNDDMVQFVIDHLK
ncbi:MAG: alpha/beta hydrolase [Acidobacteriota bacterium]